MRSCVVVVTNTIRATVPGRSYEQVSHSICPVYGVEQGLREPSPTPGVVADLGAFSNRVVEGLDSVRGVSTVRSQELERHDPGSPVDANNAEVVVPFGSDRTGDMRAVIVACAADWVAVVDARIV